MRQKSLMAAQIPCRPSQKRQRKRCADDTVHISVKFRHGAVYQMRLEFNINDFAYPTIQNFCSLWFVSNVIHDLK